MEITVEGDNELVGKRRRIRRTPDVARQAVLDAARDLLRSNGPTAVTLQGVARATGMTHGNITHHFGTSSALHGELTARMAADLASKAEAAVMKLRSGELEAEAVVDLVFSAFVDTGCGKLVGWLSATGDDQAIAPIFEALAGSVRAYRENEPPLVEPDKMGAGPIALELLSHALTASLVGSGLEEATGMPVGSLRNVASGRVRALRIVEEGILRSTGTLSS